MNESDSFPPDTSTEPDPRRGSQRSHRSASTIADLELAFAQNPKASGYHELCEAYILVGRFMEAMVVCKKAIKTKPESIDAQILLARIYAAQKKFARALRQLDAALAQNTNNVDLLLARAKTRSDNGMEAEAVEDFQAALRLNPGCETAQAALKLRGIQILVPASIHSRVPSGLASSDGALPVPDPASDRPSAGFGAGFRHSSISPAALGMNAYSSVEPMGRQKLEGEEELESLANEYADKNEKRGSAALSVALIFVCLILVSVIVAYRFHEKNKTEAIAALTISATAKEKQDTFRGYQKAAQFYERILQEHNPDHRLTIGRLAYVLAILWGEHGDSARQAELDKWIARGKSQKQSISYGKSAEGLRLLYGDPDRIKGAQSAYQVLRPYLDEVEEKGGEAIVSEMTLGLIELELGNYDSAVSKLGSVSKRLPSSVRAKVLSGRAYLRAGHLGKAEFAYTKALNMSRGFDHPSARVERALVRLQRGELAASDEDIKLFREHLRKFPKDVSERDRALAEYARSEVLRSAGHDAEADIAYQNATEADPRNADFPFGKGRWLLKLGRAASAIQPLQSALKLEPNRRAFLIGLAEAEIETGRYAEARKRLNAVLSERPKNIDALVVKGKLLSRQKSPNGAKFHAEFVASSNGHVRALLQQAEYFRAMSKDAKAVAALEKAIKSMTRYSPSIQAQVLLAYGLLKEITGEDLVAVKCFKKAAEFGQLEAWYHVIRIQSQGDTANKKEAKLACQRYLSAGTGQIHHQEAKVLCGLAPPPEPDLDEDE